MNRFGIFALVVAGVALLGCGENLGGPQQVRPIVRVHAAYYPSGATRTQVQIGGLARLTLTVYSPTDSAVDYGATWTARNPSIATVVGNGATGRQAGSTYIVGDINDNGVAFRDSVELTVIP